MNKLFTFLFVAALGAVASSADNVTVFLNDAGNNDNDGSTPELAVKSLTRAFDLIPVDADGTIVVNGKFTQVANFVPSNKRTGTITYTQVYNGVDYRGSDPDANAWTMAKGLRLGLSCDTRFENITFNQTAAAGGFLLVISNFHHLTVGEGCAMHGNFKWDAIATSFTVLGGCQDNNNLAPEVMNPLIDILSGDVFVIAHNRGAAKNFTRNSEFVSSHATVNISGGTVHALYAGSHGDGVNSGSTDVNITGGEFNGSAYLGTTGVFCVTGKEVNVNVTGGKFPAYRVFNAGSSPSTSINLSVHSLPEADQYTLLHYTMVKDFKSVSADLLIPENVFKSGTTTLDDGTEMPYRYYVAEKAGDTPYLVLYLHDSGSRGDDNRLHLCTMGASPLYQLVNSGKNVIIVGAQVPKDECWVTGTGGLQEESEGTKWLDGAVALAKKFADDYSVSPTNMSLVGSSNGAAACWHLMDSPAPGFSRAAPIAGYENIGTRLDEFVSNTSHRPIWAFHGTDDATIPVDGMRTLAPLLKAANPDFTYTEYDGGTHATIYSLAANTPGFTNFFFNDFSGVDDAIADDPIKIDIRDNALTISGNQPGGVYNMQGLCMGKKPASATTFSISEMPSGLYIVATPDGARKVAVR